MSTHDEIAHLERQLRQLAAAVDDNDFARATPLLAEHEARLATLDLQRADAGQVQRLHALLRAQQDLVQRMASLRDAAGTRIQRGTQSRRAAHAYRQAGSLT